MADSIVTLKELLSKLTEGREFDFFREAMLAVLRELMEIEVTAKTGASLGERAPERLCMRNGYRERRLDTRVGSLSLPIPKSAVPKQREEVPPAGLALPACQFHP